MMPAKTPSDTFPLGHDSIIPARTRPFSGSWSERYGERHRWHRIDTFPAGIDGPKKVRLYSRQEHFVLQWWDPGAKKNFSERVNGDLVTAITRARQIEERLRHFRSSGPVRPRRLDHTQMVEAFLTDLRQRADAGDIDPATGRRYAVALRHYLAFCQQPEIARAYPYATDVNRVFRLRLTAFLAEQQVVPQGRNQERARPLKGQRFILDTVRALYTWAGDPERGHQLPEGFHNPFLHSTEARSVFQGDPLAAPDITLDMALAFIQACDHFQLRLFVPMVLFGLRAAEPCFLFLEYLDAEWLRVPCNSDLSYRTKGRRDKRFPLLEELQEFWEALRGGRAHGLLYERRTISEGREQRPLRGLSLAEVIAEYQRRCVAIPTLNAATKKELRDAVLCEAGGLNYDHIQGEFAGLARRLHWPVQATLKDLRHLFATTMNNACLPEAYRRYLMGQAPGRAAISAYTHLHELPRHYAEAVRREWAPLLVAIHQRLHLLRSAVLVGSNCLQKA